MFFDKETRDLRDDGFEGSSPGPSSFMGVLFGYHNGDNMSRFSEAINSENESSKKVDALFCSSSENSGSTNQSSKVQCLPETLNLNRGVRGNSALKCFSEDLVMQEMANQNAYLMRTNYSADKLSSSLTNTKELFNSPVLSNENIYGGSNGNHYGGMSCENIGALADNYLYPVTFPLVDSYCQGVAWSSNLLKQRSSNYEEASIGNTDLSDYRVHCAEWNFGTEVPVSIAIASPASQESHATKLLVASSSACDGAQTVYPLNADNRTIGYDLRAVTSSRSSSRKDAESDPRPRLQCQVADLLKAAGWLVTKHQRPCRLYSESKYRSPTGRSYREFPRVWKQCGELLLSDKFVFVQEDVLWTNISSFFSDLYDTLLSIEKEQKQSEASISLAHWWNLLDPFVTIISIDKRIGMLRKGEAVKASRKWLIDKNEKRKVVLGLKHGERKNEKRGTVLALGHDDVNMKQLAEVQLTDVLSNSLHPSESEITGLNCQTDAFPEQSRGGCFLEYGCHGAEPNVALLPGMSVHTVNGDAKVENEKEASNYRNEIGSGSPMTLLAYLSEGANIFPGSCLDNFHLSSGSVYSHPGGFKTVPPNLGGKIGCLQWGEQSGEFTVERLGEPIEGKEIVARKDEQELLQDRDELFEDNGNGKLLPLLLASHDNCLKCGYCCLPGYCKSCEPVDSHDRSRDHPNVLLNQDEPCSSGFRFSEITEQTAESQKEGHQCTVSDVILKKKIRRKSKKISEIKSVAVHQTVIVGQTFDEAEPLDIDINSSQSELVQVCELSAAGTRSPGSCKSSSLSSCKHQIEKKRAKLKKVRQDCGDSEKETKRLRTFEIEDDDLLVSAILKNKGLNLSSCRFMPKTKLCKSRVRRMMKSQSGGCRLLPRHLGKAGKLSVDGKWSMIGARTVLSWLINSGVISLDDIIQYHDPKDKSVIKDGRVTMDGINCKCCNKVLSLSQFKIHAGFKLNRPCLNLFLECGEPFTLCEFQAWSSEYRTRKICNLTTQDDDGDRNDDSCGLCGDGGELICCDNCPSTFHQSCLSTEDLPEGNWYCSNCTCWMCGDLVSTSSTDARKCSQCEHKYHESCMNQRDADGVTSDTWFCGAKCQEVYSGLHARIGLINHIGDGYSWTLLRCIHNDQKVHSAQRFALTAECNTKLAVALSIVEECFASMVDPRTGINMIPHVLYNWGSEFARLNFLGFYTVVLEKDDVLITVASVRVHGVTVAEMPLIATCSKFRRQGMCRRVMTAIEELLASLKVEKLVIAAIPEVVETWTKGFGFKIVEKDEKDSLNKINLMVLPGTILLKKTLFPSQKLDLEAGLVRKDDPSPSGLDPTCASNLTESELHSRCAQSPAAGNCTRTEAADTLRVIEDWAAETNTALTVGIPSQEFESEHLPDKEPPIDGLVTGEQKEMLNSVHNVDNNCHSSLYVCDEMGTLVLKKAGVGVGGGGGVGVGVGGVGVVKQRRKGRKQKGHRGLWDRYSMPPCQEVVCGIPAVRL